MKIKRVKLKKLEEKNLLTPKQKRGIQKPPMTSAKKPSEPQKRSTTEIFSTYSPPNGRR